MGTDDTDAQMVGCAMTTPAEDAAEIKRLANLVWLSHAGSRGGNFDALIAAVDRLAAAADAQAAGEVVVTKNNRGVIVAVTRQDEDGKILSTLAESDAQAAGAGYDALRELRPKLHQWHERAVAIGADGIENLLHAAEVAKRRGELRTADGFAVYWKFPGVAQAAGAGVREALSDDTILNVFLAHGCTARLMKPCVFQAVRSLLATPSPAARAEARGSTLSAFDAAVAMELPRVSHLEYDSHEICKTFADHVRAILAATGGTQP